MGKNLALWILLASPLKAGEVRVTEIPPNLRLPLGNTTGVANASWRRQASLAGNNFGANLGTSIPKNQAMNSGTRADAPSVQTLPASVVPVQIPETAAAAETSLPEMASKASDRHDRVRDVLEDPAVPLEVKKILLGSNIMATTLRAKPLSWFKKDIALQQLKALQAALSRISPDLEVTLAEEKLRGSRVEQMRMAGRASPSSGWGTLPPERAAEKVELMRLMLIGTLRDPDFRRPLKRLLRAHFPSRPDAAIEAMLSALERDAADLDIRFATPEEENLFFKKKKTWAYYQRIQTEGSAVQSRILLSRKADLMHAPSLLLSAVTFHELVHYTLGLGEHAAHRMQALLYRHLQRELEAADLNPNLTDAKTLYQAGLVHEGLAQLSEHIHNGQLTHYLLANYEPGYFAATRRPDDRLAILKFRYRLNRRLSRVLRRRAALETRGMWQAMSAARRRAWERAQLPNRVDRKYYRDRLKTQNPEVAARTLGLEIARDARSIKVERRRLDSLDPAAAPPTQQAMRRPDLRILDNTRVSKREAIRRVGFNPRRRPGTLLNYEDKSSWAEVLRIPWQEGQHLGVKTFYPGLAGLWPWNAAVRASSHEVFISQVIEAFFASILASPRYMAYVDGLILRKGVVVMDWIDATPDANRLALLPFTVRAALAAVALTFGVTDVNPKNILHHRSGKHFWIDKERLGAETIPTDSGFFDLSEKPWVSNDYFNTLEEPAFYEVLRSWLDLFWRHETQSALKHMLRRSGIRGRTRKAYMAVFRDNARRLMQAVESNMLGANLNFRQQIEDAKMDYHKVGGVLSEINKSAQTPEGGVYRDLVRFLIARHGLSDPFGLDWAPGKAYVLNPGELAALLRHLKGGLIPESYYRDALEQWRLGRWSSPDVTEAQLRPAFEQLNRWLDDPPPVPNLPDPSKRSKKAA